MAVHCLASGWIGLYIPSNLEISLSPQDVPRASPSGHLSGLGKSLGRRGYTTQYIPPLGSVRIQYLSFKCPAIYMTFSGLVNGPLVMWPGMETSYKLFPRWLILLYVYIGILSTVYFPQNLLCLPLWPFSNCCRTSPSAKLCWMVIGRDCKFSYHSNNVTLISSFLNRILKRDCCLPLKKRLLANKKFPSYLYPDGRSINPDLSWAVQVFILQFKTAIFMYENM